MNQDDLIFKTILSCVPLRQIGENMMPINHASGVIINYFGKKVLLSVFHATGDFTNWAIEIESDFKTGTFLKNLGLMGSVVTLNIDSDEIDRIDFSYASLPDDIITYHQVVDEETNQIYEHARMILDIDFDVKPSIERKYSFFGQTEFKTNDKIIIPVGKLVMDMDFVDETEEYYVFKLPFKHPGHLFFRGTSGAPILDDVGNLISLVRKGIIKNDLIYGLKLSKYKPFIDIQVGNIK